MPIFKSQLKPQFIVCSQDYSGLGFAKLCSDAGYPVILAFQPKEGDDLKNYEMVGESIVEKMELEKAVKEFTGKGAYWIVDQNFGFEIFDKLRAGGEKVFGGHELTDKMENDRGFGASLVKKAGVEIPETVEFNSVAEGVAFLEANEDKNYVFKPDEPDDKAWVTTMLDNDIPEKANEGMRRFLNSMGEGQGSYILQEKKRGVEINVEVWLFEGEPFFAHANFESKRKYNGDLGRMIGCAHDIEFLIPLESKIVRDTLLKLVRLPEFKDFTGMVDMNLISADREYYFLEFCGRFGYNSHPNLFINLAIDSFPEIIRDFLDGDTTDFYKHFRPGFGASILMSIDDPVRGLPFLIAEETKKNFYHYDTYKDGEDYCLAGYAREVGIVCAHDYDLKSAADKVLENFNKISYPGRAGRTDLNLTNYDNNPWERYIAAVAMKILEKS